MPLQLEQRAILQPFISEGRVDYAALDARLDLPALLAPIAWQPIDEQGIDAQLAFYLNAYNLLTLDQVLERLRLDPQWPGPVSLWSKLEFFLLQRHRVAGRRLSLYSIENRVLRKRFRDPRIHFALNCASASCPALPGFLFDAEHLEDDLEALTSAFVNSDAVNYVPDSATLFLNPIFKWYRADFKPSVYRFLRRYRDLPEPRRIVYVDYDWRLNARR